MKKFGFGKKDKASPGPPSDNPYAQQQAPVDDPYANDKYANMPPARTGGLPAGPRASVGLPGGPKAGGMPPPASNGYGSDRYGASGGYGANRYGDDNGGYGQGARASGGYGSMGGNNGADVEDPNRAALFAGAKPGLPGGPKGGRYSEQTSSSYGGGGAPNYGARGNDDPNRAALFAGAQNRSSERQNGYGQSSASSGNYGGYGQERELTEEEQEAQAVRDINDQSRALKKDTEDSADRVLQLLDGMEETGSASLARLAAQGDRLHNTEKNLDIAAQHNRVADERTGQLRHATRSMFAVGVKNPFTDKRRAAERAEEKMLRDHEERDQQASTRREQYQSEMRLQGHWNSINGGGDDGGARSGATKSDYNKYAIEDSDEEANENDRQLEARLDEKFGRMELGMKRVHKIAVAMGDEVEHQNKLIDRIGEKTDSVDDDVRRNQRKLQWAARNEKKY